MFVVQHMRMGSQLCAVAALTFMMSEAFGQTTSGSSCSAVLEAGVYNTFSASSSGASFSQVQSALCQSYAGYSYSKYQTQRSALNSAITSGSVSQAVASAYCNSQAHTFEVAAQASFFGIGGGASYGQGSSSSNCGSNSASSTASSYADFLTQNQFSLATTNINSYQQSSCGSSNNIYSTSASVQQLQQIINPQVYSAYTSCLKLYAAGIQFTQTSSFDDSTLAIDMVYKQPVNGNTKANLYGFDTTGSVSCTLRGPNVNSSAKSTLVADLTAETSYTITCKLQSTAVKNGNFSDIFIYTNPGGTFHGLIFNGAPQNVLAQVTTLQSQVAGLLKMVALQADQMSAMSALQLSQIHQANLTSKLTSQLNSKVSSQATTITTLQAQVRKPPVNFTFTPPVWSYTVAMTKSWTSIWSAPLNVATVSAGHLIVSIQGHWSPTQPAGYLNSISGYFSVLIDGVSANAPVYQAGVWYDRFLFNPTSQWKGFAVVEHVSLSVGAHTVGLGFFPDDFVVGMTASFNGFAIKGTFFPNLSD